MRLISWRPSGACGARRRSSPIVPLRCLILAGVLALTCSPVGGVALAMPEAGIPMAVGDTSRLEQASINVHTVESGETVHSIAAAYGVSSETVLAANAIDDPDLLHSGEQLLVPSVDGALHTVQPGETLRAIADAYRVPVHDLVSANALDASPDLLRVGAMLVVPGVRPVSISAQQAARTTPEADLQAIDKAPSTVDTSAGAYTVREGDTLRSIAEAFKLDILSLVEMNGLADPDLIKPGSTLRIWSRDTLEHVVEPGETVGDIAWRYSVDSHALLVANGLTDPDYIVVGTTLVIPAAHSSPTRDRASSPAPSAPAAPPVPPAPSPAVSESVAATADRVTTARVTGYAAGAGAVSARTASGNVAHWGTVAADIHLYPFGTRLRIEGLGETVFVVEDMGSAVRGNVFDVWFPDAESARRLGSRTRQVTILAPGEP